MRLKAKPLNCFGLRYAVRYRMTLEQWLNGKKQWKMRWKAKPLIHFGLSYAVFLSCKTHTKKHKVLYSEFCSLLQIQLCCMLVRTVLNEWMNENLYIAHKKTSTQNLACSHASQFLQETCGIKRRDHGLSGWLRLLSLQGSPEEWECEGFLCHCQAVFALRLWYQFWAWFF